MAIFLFSKRFLGCMTAASMSAATLSLFPTSPLFAASSSSLLLSPHSATLAQQSNPSTPSKPQSTQPKGAKPQSTHTKASQPQSAKPQASQPQGAEAESDSIPTTMLDDLVVESKVALVQNDGAKITYNTESDPTAASGTVIDLLRKVPGVSVSGDDEVSLNGMKSFKWQLNGRDEPVMRTNAKDVLRAMPSAMVERVEVIRDPGAKEDAEGAGGIINIVLMQAQKQVVNDGAAGRLNLNAGLRGESASGNVIAKKGDFTVSATGVYSMTGPMINSSDNVTEIEYLKSGDRLSTESSQQQHYNYGMGSINMSWQPNAANLFTAGGNLTHTRGWVDGTQVSQTMTDSQGRLLWRTLMPTSMTYQSRTVSANTAYQHNFASPGHNIVLSYLFNYTPIEVLMSNWLEEKEGPAPLTSPAMESNRLTFAREHTVQLDYTNPLGGGAHTIEAGAKGIFRHNTTDNANLYGPSLSELTQVESVTDRIMQLQDVLAVYASYTGRYGAFTTRLGVRDEYTHGGLDYRMDPSRDFRAGYNDVVPNASLAYSFGSTGNLRLAYSMRITRPNIEQINPFLLRQTETVYSKGNPDLTSEHTHSLSLSYSQYGRLLGGSLTLTGAQSNDIIEGYSYTEGERFITTYANLGRRREMLLSASVMSSAIPGMNISLNATTGYAHITSPSLGLSNHGWTGEGTLQASYMAPHDWILSAYGGGGILPLSLESRQRGHYEYHGFGVSKRLLPSKRLTVGLNFTNVFAPTKHWYTTSFSPGEYSSTTRVTNHNQWEAALTIGWSFGNLRDDVKRTQTSITNDDLDALKTN